MYCSECGRDLDVCDVWLRVESDTGTGIRKGGLSDVLL